MKNVTLFLSLLVSSSVASFGQTSTQNSVKTDSVVLEKEEVFTVVEVQPQFPGGINEMMAFISSNISYPIDGEKNGIEGKVIASFVVGKDGSINELTILKALGPEFDNEVLRVIGLMPNWIPGKLNGRNVKVKMTIPVKFAIAKKNKK